MRVQVWFAFTETSAAAGNNRTRLGLTGFGWRLDLITTMTRVMRILLLALFFISVAEFALEHSRIDLELMTGAFTILLWGGLWKPRCIHTPSKKDDPYVHQQRHPNQGGTSL